MKILILMSYFNRPKLVRNALSSIIKAGELHSDWELVFGDDGSDIPGEPIVKEVMQNCIEKVKIINTKMSFVDKINKGLMLGKYCNEVISNSDSDIGIMFSDDDEIHPDYFKKLNDYFLQNKDILYCFSKIHLFNPLIQKSHDVKNLDNKYNKSSVPIVPMNQVDASQVAWRLDCCKKHGAWFANSTNFDVKKPLIKDTDKSFFEKLYEKCGLCHPTFFVSQYKGIHDYQLLWHKNADEHELKKYYELVKSQAGVLL